MIPVTVVLARLPGLDEATLLRWIAQDWVRPARRGGEVLFAEIDIARLRLILELRDALELQEEALPVVLSLLDQLHATRRHMRLLCAALQESRGTDTVDDIIRRLVPPG